MVQKLKAANEAELFKCDEKTKDAQENLGDIEVKGPLFGPIFEVVSFFVSSSMCRMLVVMST